MMKRWMAMGMALCLTAASLAGCSGTKDAAESTQAEAETSAEEAAAEEETAKESDLDKLPYTYVTSPLNVPTIIEKYLATYDHKDDQEVWFGKIRQIADELGYAVKPKDFKKNPDQYKGHVGHVSTVIRVALMGRQQSPDVWEIQQILGEERTRARLAKFV